MANIDASSWEALVTTALLGTNHRPYDSDILPAVATLSLCRRVATPPEAPWPAPSAAPPETRAAASSRFAAFFFVLVEDGPGAVLDEWFAVLHDSGLRAPADALPSLLWMLASDPRRERDIRPVLGAAGEWLIQQNPQWAFLADLSYETWQTGSPERRLDLFLRVRQHRPEQARQWLEETFAGESIDRRAAFVTALGRDLSAADAPLLELAFQDRRKEVRAAALPLLARLPESSVVQEWQRLVRLFLRDGVPPHAPGLDVKPGPEAWWRGMVSRVPVEEVVEGAPVEAFVGWALAARHFQQAAEGELILRHISPGALAEPEIVGLFRLLPAPQREDLVSRRLEGDPLWPSLSVVSTWGLLRECSFAWSPELTRLFLSHLPRMKVSSGLSEVSPYVDPGLVEEGTQLLAGILNGASAARPAVEQFLGTMNLRARMRHACKDRADAV